MRSWVGTQTDMSSLYFSYTLDHRPVSEHLLISTWMAEEPQLLWSLFREGGMCTASLCSLRAMEVAAWTWESRALVLRAVLLRLTLSVFSLHLHLYSPSLCSFCVLREADLQDGSRVPLLSDFQLGLANAKCLQEREKWGCGILFMSLQGYCEQATCLNPRSQLLTGNPLYPALFVCGFW